MTPTERRRFYSLIRAFAAAKVDISPADADQIADYFSARRRIDFLRQMLSAEQADLVSGPETSATKDRVITLSRRLDAAERQSHRLAESLGLICGIM